MAKQKVKLKTLTTEQLLTLKATTEAYIHSLPSEWSGTVLVAFYYNRLKAIKTLLAARRDAENQLSFDFGHK